MMSEQYVQGMREMRSHFGKAADKWIEVIHDIYPEFAKVNVEFPFGELYRRDVIDTKTRELCTLAALTVQGFALPELKVHILGNLNAGSNREEILEVITQMIAYCGFPAATNALLAAKEVFDELDSDMGGQTSPEAWHYFTVAESKTKPSGGSIYLYVAR